MEPPPTTTDLLTALLALVTLWLAIATRSMAKATKEALTLESRPYLALQAINITAGEMGTLADQNTIGVFELQLILHSPSKVLVNYTVQEFQLKLNGEDIDLPNFTNLSGVIHPGQINVFYTPRVQAKIPAKFESRGELGFLIEFWSVKKEKKSFKARIDLNFAPGSSNVRWIYSHGPEYT